MKNSLIFSLLMVPTALFAQCSIDLGPDISNCSGGPVLLTAITNGQAGADSLRITYNAGMGVSGLAGATSVYMHSGIQTVPFGPWEYVVGNWGINDGIGQMQSLGNNMWQKTIAVQNYYGFLGGTTVIGIWMVFRNGDGSATGRNDQDQDIFLNTSDNNTSNFGGVTGTNIAASTGTVTWNVGPGVVAISISVGMSGQYTATYVDGAGCTVQDEINVSISFTPLTIDLGANQMLCNGQSVTLDIGAGYTSYLWSNGLTTSSINVTEPGDYSVSVTDGSGCTGFDLVNVAVGVDPTADFSYQATSGLTYSFTDQSTDATSIEWDLDGDGTTDQTTAPGATVQHTFPSFSVYSVVATAINACGEDQSSQNVLVSGMDETAASIGLQVGPVPTLDQLTVTARITLANVELIDLCGRSVLTKAVQSTSTTINLYDLKPGTYQLRVSTLKNTITTRNIIKLP